MQQNYDYSEFAPQSIQTSQQATLGGIGSGFGNFGKGVLDALSNMFVVDPLNIAGRITGSQTLQNIPQLQTGQGGAYTAGNIAGNIGGSLPVGGELGALRLGAEGIPLIGRLATALGKGLPGYAADIATGTGFGALTNPQDISGGAEKGGAIAALLSALPGGTAAYRSIKAAVNPEPIANQLLNTLGQGRTLQENALSLGQDVVQGYKNAKSTGVNNFDSIFNNPSVASGSIYDNITPTVPTKTPLGQIYLTNAPDYRDISGDTIDNYSSSTKDLHDAFIANPTLKNAHYLQSQIGSDIRSYQKGMIDPGKQATINSLQSARNQLNSDIQNSLNSSDPSLGQQYNDAKNYWQQNVVPYTSVPGVVKLLRASNANDKFLPAQSSEENQELPDITNPNAISGLFKNVNPQNSTNINKIVQDLGPDFKNKVLYSYLGKSGASQNADSLSNAISKLDEQGLSGYVNPDVQNIIDSLNNKRANRIGFQGLAGLAGGAALAHSFGGGAIPEILGALSGAAGTPIAAHFGTNYLSKFIPKIDLSPISNAIQKGYGTGAAAIKGAAIPSYPQNQNYDYSEFAPGGNK